MNELGKETYRILLFTNRDSDNLGDKIIEACDIALIRTVMKNLHVSDYEIQSYDAEVIFNKKNEELIRDSDLTLLGGAPLFNYRYQNFYQRTIITIELAEKYNKPVVISSVGIESYNENDERCQKLKKALNSSCVKLITTRDGYNLLKKYKENPDLYIGKVADPAVWTKKVFEKFVADVPARGQKKIGIVVIRAGVLDNKKFNLPIGRLMGLCCDIAEAAEKKGYDCEFISSGHFSDEALLDFLIRKSNGKITEDKCIFNMNKPEDLVSKISEYDGVVSFRLHPSIVAFSLGVPSLGIAWNPKVKKFYSSVGHSDRIVYINENINAQDIVDRLEDAMAEGVSVDEDYLMSVYNSLFRGIREAMGREEDDTAAYSLNDVMEDIPIYPGTPESIAEEDLKRKFRRTYGDYNNSLFPGFKLIYNSGMKSEDLACSFDESKGEIKKLDTGSVEYWLDEWVRNDTRATFSKNGFSHPEYIFVGWQMRAKGGDGQWHWYLEDGNVLSKAEITSEEGSLKKIFEEGEVIPPIPLKKLSTVVVEAVWGKAKAPVLYNSGSKFQGIKWTYNCYDGEVNRLQTGSFELKCPGQVLNDGTTPFKKNGFIYPAHCFVGWKLRARAGKIWYWYLEDGSLYPKDEYKQDDGISPVKIFPDGSNIPCIRKKDVNLIVADAVWKAAEEGANEQKGFRKWKKS